MPVNTSSRCSLHRCAFGRVLGELLCLLNTTVGSLCSSLEEVIVTLLGFQTAKRASWKPFLKLAGGGLASRRPRLLFFYDEIFFFFFLDSVLSFLDLIYIMDVSSALEAHQNKL
jgi:hypothetical protein